MIFIKKKTKTTKRQNLAIKSKLNQTFPPAGLFWHLSCLYLFITKQQCDEWRYCGMGIKPLMSLRWRMDEEFSLLLEVPTLVYLPVLTESSVGDRAALFC